MEAKDCLAFIPNVLHTTIVATVDDESLPVTAAIDMTDSDENGLYFLTAFQIYEGGGEWFYLTGKPIERASFTFGGTEEKKEGYFITDACIGCQSCVSVCPQQCTHADPVPLVINRENCLHCENCMLVCPAGAVERR